MANTNLSRDKGMGVSGPPTQNASGRAQQRTAFTQTASGNRATPPGAKPGQGPTPDAAIRQKVLNKGQDSRRNGDGGASRLDEGNATGVAGPPIQPRPIGSPPGQAAPPRTPSGQEGQLPAPVGPTKVGEDPRQAPQNTAPTAPGIPGTPQGPPGSQDVAQQVDATQPQGADQIRDTASAQAASGQPLQPAQSPGASPQENAAAVQAQSEGIMAQKPEPPMSKSPLGAESPIEQSDAMGKLRAGTRHHIRALGFKTSGMDPKTAKNYERMAVRDFDQFGEYDGMDDPHSPPPPIRVGQHSFNPATGQYVVPEGQVSILDRMAPRGARGPGTLLSVDNVRKGKV